MVNIVENWAEIVGEVMSVRKDPAKRDYQLVSIRIISNKNVRSYPNLIRPSRQNTIILHIRRHDVAEVMLKKGDTIKLHVRAAPNAYFINVETLKKMS